MKRIAALLALAAAVAAAPVLAQAPGAGGRAGGDGGERGGRGFGRRGRGLSLLATLPPAVETKLKLTADQKSKLDKIRTSYRQKSEQVLRSGAPAGGAGAPDGGRGPGRSGSAGGPGRSGSPGGPGSQPGAGSSGDRGRGEDRRAARRALMEKLDPIRQKAEADAEAVLKADQKKTWEAVKGDAKSFAGLGFPSVRALLSVDGLTADQKGKLKTLADQTETKRSGLFPRRGGPGGGSRPSGADMQAAIQKFQAMEKETQGSVRKLLTPAQAKQFDAALAAAPSWDRRGGGGGGSFRRGFGGQRGTRPPSPGTRA